MQWTTRPIHSLYPEELLVRASEKILLRFLGKSSRRRQDLSPKARENYFSLNKLTKRRILLQQVLSHHWYRSSCSKSLQHRANSRWVMEDISYSLQRRKREVGPLTRNLLWLRFRSRKVKSDVLAIRTNKISSSQIKPFQLKSRELKSPPQEINKMISGGWHFTPIRPQVGPQSSPSGRCPAMSSRVWSLPLTKVPSRTCWMGGEVSCTPI